MDGEDAVTNWQNWIRKRQLEAERQRRRSNDAAGPATVRFPTGYEKDPATVRYPQGHHKALDKDGFSEALAESGWDLAANRLGARPTVPADTHPSRTSTSPSVAIAASAARKRIRAVATPVFATATDTAVNADLIIGFLRTHGGPPALPKLRQAYVATAVRHFATEFARTIGSAPKGTSEHLALGAIIASALAQTAREYPIVPPAAVPAMSVLIHKKLQPQLPALARLAATIAVAPNPGPAKTPAAPLHETAW